MLAKVWLAAVVVAAVLMVTVSPWVQLIALAVVLAVVATRRPSWWPSVRRPVVACAVAALALTGVIGLTVERAAADARKDQELAAWAEYARAQMLPDSPVAAVRGVLRAVAANDPAAACGTLTPAAGDQLAAALDVPDCPAAVVELHALVADPAEYGSPDSNAVTTSATSPDREVAEVDACSLRWDGLTDILGGPTMPAMPPGPQLGHFEVRREQAPPSGPTGYRITGYTPCPHVW